MEAGAKWISREVAVGSRVRVKPGEKIALDGLVVSGRSMVNQAPITGGGACRWKRKRRSGVCRNNQRIWLL